ncbi:amine dehydrogenase large subunit [Castellaniella caeni]|uniref:amine dehydrogenase large subunit n=1 Tax=Castellaniella caeni TaxID=266123 RepID=UPI00082951D2|nr:amine dehydrogenase large subunit [Castellaniella caeni]
MKKTVLRRSSQAGLLSLALLVGGTAASLAANLPVEKLVGGQSVKVDPAQRVYVMDAVFMHLTDSRLNQFDRKTGKFLGMIPTSFNGLAQVSKDGKNIYVATTYYERVTRGERTDTVEIWDNSTLSFVKEIVVPPKKAGTLNYDGMFRQTNDGRFILLQNATPAASVTVVDAQKRAFVNEITATAGCWSIIPVPGAPRSFSTICGDGALLTVTLGDDGKVASQNRSQPMFPVKDDPIFITPGLLSDRMVFVSFYGNVYTAKPTKDGMSFEPTWSLLDQEDKAKNWVPGGYNLLAVEPKSQRLYIFMHPDGKEGSHKNPAAEIWVYDLKTKQRVARIPGQDALSMSVIPGKHPQLLTIDGGNAHIYDISAPEPKLVQTIKGASESALQLMGWGGNNG